MRKQSFPFWLALISLLFFASCRKSDFESTTTAENPTAIDRFFKLPESADPRLKSIAQSIKSQEKEHPFLNDFTKKTGWPVWSKAKILDKSNMSGGQSNADNSALVYVPFVKDAAIIVNAVLAVRMNVSDTAWRLLHASNYESFGFEAATNGNWNARNVFQFFALFQHDIFGHTKFLIKDKRLFNTTSNSFIITLKERNGETVNGRTNRSLEWHEVTQCGTWQVCGAGAPPAMPRTSSINDDCYYIDVCNTYYYDDFNDPSGGTGWTGISWTSNSGGGGSGSGSWANNDPCANQTNACTAGWSPSTSYVTLDGVTYTTENYPGMNAGYPWLWWDVPQEVEIDPNVTNNDPSMIWWDPSVTDPNTVYTQQTRPGWQNTYNNYPKNAAATDDMPSSEVCAMIGGEVLTKYNQGKANNACCLRVSRALLYSGVNIPAISGQTWQGADGKNYFYYVEHLFNWLNQTFGAPDVHKTAADGAPRGTKFADLLMGLQNRGIYIMKPTDRAAFGASGHATLWGGLNCIGGKNYFKDASDVYIWRLPQ